MDILIGGCSFTAGQGFAGQKHDPAIWPNLIAQKVGARINNVAKAGYDNAGIYLNILNALSNRKYDLILIQITSLDRIILSPNINGCRLVNEHNISNGMISDQKYQEFFKTFCILNQPFEHWLRLIKMISYLQTLPTEVVFINGLLDWDDNFFQGKKSDFMKYVLDEDNLLDDKIDQGRKIVFESSKKIDLTRWVNLTDSMKKLKVDNAGPQDKHPGPKTHKLIAEKIYNHLQYSLKGA